MSKYQGFCIVEIGTNGTGKTHWMLNIINGYPKDVLITMDDDSEDAFDFLDEIEPNQIGKFRGKATCLIDDDNKSKDEYFNEIYDGFGKKNGNFVGGLWCIDDAMTVLEARPRESAKKIFKKRRQRRLDIILNCHGASEFPVSLFKNMTHFVIFKTVDSYEGITQRMNRETAQIFVKCINIVNQRALENPYYHMVFDLRNPPNI